MSEDAVWIDVLPSMEKFGPALASGADKAADKQGKGAGRKFGLAMAAGVTAVAGGAVLAGKALYDIGATFDDVTDTIRVGTGATGDALEGLVASAKTVGTKVPASFEDISTTVADVNTRLGLTGTTLETFSGQVLEAGRLTGEAIDINKISSAFSAFRIEGEATTGAMDTLYRVSQDTGVGMNELAGLVQKAGPAVQALGFNFDQTAALVGGLDKAGLDASKMTAGLSRALVELSKDGEEPAVAFQRVTGEIEGFAKSGNDAAAIDLASKLFGTRNAPQFVQAIKEGRLSIEDLTAAAEGSGDTIMQASEDTRDFGEAWEVFKNTLLLLVEPAATALFDVISQGMKWISDNAIPWIERMKQAWADSEGPVGRVREVFEKVWTALKDTLLPVMREAQTFITEKFVPAFMSVVDYVNQKVIPVIKDYAYNVFLPAFKAIGKAVDVFWNSFAKPALSALWTFIRDVLAPTVKWLWENVFAPAFGGIGKTIKWTWESVISPALSALEWTLEKVIAPTVTWLWQNIVKPAFEGIGKAVSWAWSNVIKPTFDAVKWTIDNRIAPTIRWLNENVFQPTFKKIGDIVDGFGRTWSRVWDGIKSATAKPINAVIRFINTGLVGGFNFVAEKVGMKTRLGKLSTISGYARGGILPGQSRYSDGDDQLIMARRGEGIVVSEALRDPYERERLLALNKAALQGIPMDEFRAHYDGFAAGGVVGGELDGFARGGIVSYKGKRFTAIFAAALRAAEQAAGHSFRITQGGFRPRTSYSGTSHAGDAVDIGRPFNIRSIAALRKHGIAAWDRTGKGNWIPHIHGVPLPGYGRAAGSAVWQAQDYLRGGDGLGGRDNGPRGASIIGGLKGLAAAFQSGFESIKDWFGDIWGKVTGPFKDFKSAITGDSFISKIVTGVADQLKSGLETWIKDKIGYASGTNFARPGVAWVGERGPELVRFRGGERVWSNSDSVRMASGGPQGSTIHVHNLHLPDGVETAIDLVRELERLPLRVHMQGVA